MRISRLLLAPALAASVLLTACSSGSTEVSGAGGRTTGATGTTAGSGATGGAPSGPTASTGGGGLGGPVSVDTQAQAAAGMTAAFYSCDGVEGTWNYTVKGGPLDFDIDTTVDMAGGDGTMVISDSFEIPGLGTISFTDTVDLVIAGTPEAPTFRATNVKVDVEAPIPGVEDVAQALFTEGAEVPIVAGAEQC